ncbi:hypothetical protein KUTeg_000670 [Tegillarca granosa]|uniref:Peroxidase n=1 Tax=Tegillarca granosa TaxID=220873 RepID=A0ABQ9FYC2_TEGGR|nr:hypothetical protein KUTeg_000670 [Tegillarca granosa]
MIIKVINILINKDKTMATKCVIVVTLLILHATISSSTRVKRQGKSDSQTKSNGNGAGQSGNNGNSNTGSQGTDPVGEYKLLLERAMSRANATVLQHFASRNNIQETNALLLEQTLLEMVEITGLTVKELLSSPDFETAYQEVTSTRIPPGHSQIECKQRKYRTMDGTCNNLFNKRWGSAFTSQARYLPPVYEDGNEGAPIVDCCNTNDSTRIECFPISIPADDGHFTTSCMNFIRSTAGFPNGEIKPGPRDQINAITSFVDGSNVYGSSEDQMNELRTGQNGLLKTSEFNFPPPDSEEACILDHTGEFCLKAGDERVNVVPHLQVMHTLFVREHNRIARLLAQHKSGWNDQKIFQTTRKIIAAVLQHISYNEYLPILLGADVMAQEIGHESSQDTYDDAVNPSIKNAFGAAAFRYGHSLIPSRQVYLLSDYSTREEHRLEETFFRPHLLEQQNGARAPDLSRWMSHDSSFKADRFIERGVRDFLFKDGDGNSFDLASLNIQRGRDHGLPAYNQWREFCGLPKALSFEVTDGGLVDHTTEAAGLLSKTYSHVDDIDLFVGGLTETHKAGGIVGPTFSCIIAKQFSDLKKGDRFWYERINHNGGFTADQLSEIKKVSLAKVLCNNFGMAEIQPEVFRTPSLT